MAYSRAGTYKMNMKHFTVPASKRTLNTYTYTHIYTMMGVTEGHRS